MTKTLKKEYQRGGSKRQFILDKAVEYLDPIKNKIIGYHAQLSQKHFFIDGFKKP